MSDKWRVRHPGIGVLAYDSEAEARVAAGTAGEVLAPDPVQPDLRALAAEALYAYDVDTYRNLRGPREDDIGRALAVLAAVLPAHRRQVLAEAADEAERALRSESDRLAAPGEDTRAVSADRRLRHVNEGIGAVKATNAVRHAILSLAATAPATVPAPSLTAQDGPVVPQVGAEAPRPSQGDLQPELAPAAVAPTQPAEPLAPPDPAPGWESVAALQQAYDEMAERWQYRGHQLDDAARVGRQLIAERDAALAHDVQRYPTADAYEAACVALDKHRQRADAAEAERDRLLECTAFALGHYRELWLASVRQRAAGPRDPAADAAESATWEAMRLLLAKVEGERDEARAELGALQRHFALANDSAIDNGDWLQDAREELTALNDQLWHALDIDPETSPSLADMVDMLVGQTGELGEECERLRVERDRLAQVVRDAHAAAQADVAAWTAVREGAESLTADRDRLAAAVERVRALAQRWVDTGTAAGAGVLASAVFHALDEQPEAGR